MSVFDQAVLLITGLVALYLIWRFFGDYQKNKPTYDVYYMVAFAVLFVAGVLLILFTYSVLASPLVVIVAALVPAGIALGLVSQFYPQYEKAYLVFVVVGLVLLAITRLFIGGVIGTVVLIVFHTVAGLTIFGLPLLTLREKVPTGFVGVTIGGVLIGVGGIALAFLKLGTQLLFFSQTLVLTILAPLLLLMTLAFAWGFVAKMKA